MIAVIDIGIGNPSAVCNMFRTLGREAVTVSEPDGAASADLLVLPGIGAFDAAMDFLVERKLDLVIREHAGRGGPLLGICLGMQLLGERSAEGTRPGLGLIPVSSSRINPAAQDLRVPNMGWRSVASTESPGEFSLIQPGDRYYFAHSFAVDRPNPYELATVDHGGPLTAAICRDKVFGVQFHPEKSHSFGRRMIGRIVARLGI